MNEDLRVLNIWLSCSFCELACIARHLILLLVPSHGSFSCAVQSSAFLFQSQNDFRLNSYMSFLNFCNATSEKFYIYIYLCVLSHWVHFRYEIKLFWNVYMAAAASWINQSEITAWQRCRNSVSAEFGIFLTVDSTLMHILSLMIV